MMTTERKKIRTAKAGETLSPKAASYMREHYPFMREVLTTKEAVTVHKKSDVKTGQWMCADCGRAMQNNMQKDSHAEEKRRHRLVWWTGERFEEP